MLRLGADSIGEDRTDLRFAPDPELHPLPEKGAQQCDRLLHETVQEDALAGGSLRPAEVQQLAAHGGRLPDASFRGGEIGAGLFIEPG